MKNSLKKFLVKNKQFLKPFQAGSLPVVNKCNAFCKFKTEVGISS